MVGIQLAPGRSEGSRATCHRPGGAWEAGRGASRAPNPFPGPPEAGRFARWRAVVRHDGGMVDDDRPPDAARGSGAPPAPGAARPAGSARVWLIVARGAGAAWRCCWSRSRRSTCGASRRSGSRCWPSPTYRRGFWAGAGLGAARRTVAADPAAELGRRVRRAGLAVPAGRGVVLLRAARRAVAPWPRPVRATAGGGAGRWSPARCGCCRRRCATGPRSAASRGAGSRSARATRRCCGWPRVGGAPLVTFAVAAAGGLLALALLAGAVRIGPAAADRPASRAAIRWPAVRR